MSGRPTLAVRELSVGYPARRGLLRAVRAVSFDVLPGEALALIGESGCGKTTLGLSLIRLLPPGGRVGGGQIIYQRAGAPPADVLRLAPEPLRRFRWRECAMVFQSALHAFNPVLRIADQFADTARAHGGPRGRDLAERAAALLRMVQLDPALAWRAYPHQLSCGMRQRALIALSLLLEPQLLILDEPTTALDVLTQRAIADLLNDLRRTLGLAMLFITHDLALAGLVADRVATLYAGALVEIGDRRTVLARPAHPYTAGLLRAAPTLHTPRAQLRSVAGAPPDLVDLPPGCPFHPRCPLASQRCRQEEPPLEPTGDGALVACWHWRAQRAGLVAPQ